MNSMKNLFTEAPKDLFNTAFHTAETGVGVVGSVVSTVTAGRIAWIENTANLTERSVEILPTLFSIPRKVLLPRSFSNFRVRDGLLIRDGLLTSSISNRYKDYIDNKVLYSKTFTDRLFVRIHISAYAFSSTVTRIADLVIGIFFAPISFMSTLATAITMNKIDSLNRFERAFFYCTRNQLSSLGLVDDLCTSFRGLTNPDNFTFNSIFA